MSKTSVLLARHTVTLVLKQAARRALLDMKLWTAVKPVV